MTDSQRIERLSTVLRIMALQVLRLQVQVITFEMALVNKGVANESDIAAFTAAARAMLQQQHDALVRDKSEEDLLRWFEEFGSGGKVH